MIVDSSVWIDFFRRRASRQAEWLRRIDPREILLGDLVLMEVLQGARDDADELRLSRILGAYQIVNVFGEKIARAAAKNFRLLREVGVTPRRQIDLIIASFCILNGHHLLHADRDFAIMARHLRLRIAAGSLPPH